MSRTGLGALVLRADGSVVEASPGVARMLGLPPAADLALLDLRDVYVEANELERLLAGARDSRAEWLDSQWRRGDGSVISVRVAIRVASTDGETRYDVIVEDVTDRRRQEELIRRSERMASLGATLAGAAHELNNPLAAIMGFSQLLLRRHWPPEDRTALEAIHHEALRSATIVKDLLALARRRGVIERRAPADINELVTYIVRTRRYALETAGIACELDLGDALPPVRGDRTQLEQVVLNLLNNSEQALRPRVDTPHAASSGRIVIRTTRDDDRVTVEVEDDGPGIPEAARSDIWDPFWTSKQDGEGTGLGLAVVHSIVVDHGGSVSLEKGALGGARFVIRLPTVAAGDTAGPPARASRPLDVLVVDPRAADLPFVQRFLTSRGHAVINAETPEAALRLASQSTFDAVLCDADLSLDGDRPIAGALRASSGCAHARFVLSTETTRVPVEEGVTYVMRPYDVEELQRLIEG